MVLGSNIQKLIYKNTILPLPSIFHCPPKITNAYLFFPIPQSLYLSFSVPPCPVSHSNPKKKSIEYEPLQFFFFFYFSINPRKRRNGKRKKTQKRHKIRKKTYKKIRKKKEEKSQNYISFLSLFFSNLPLYVLVLFSLFILSMKLNNR